MQQLHCINNSICGQRQRKRRSLRSNQNVHHQLHPIQLEQQRRLASDECLNIPGANFTHDILGPSFDENSLYNNVSFQSVMTGRSINQDTDTQETLPIYALANILLEEILRNDDAYEFVQEKEYFGRNGEFADEMLYQHQLLIDFWQVSGPRILLIGVHSEILEPEGNLELAVAILSHINQYQSDTSITDKVQEVASNARFAIETELLDGYSNYDLTADDGYFVPNFGVLGYEDSSVIVAGDGALQFDVALGHRAIGNDIFHAHEFGHALQHILDAEDITGTYDRTIDRFYKNVSPESTRYFELEADAMAAYALAHKQGRDLPISLLIEATKSAYALGDCAYTSNDHHGTPKQRECATKWGADEGLDMIGTPLTPRQFRDVFFNDYEKILALDATACNLSDDFGDSSSNYTSAIPLQFATDQNDDHHIFPSFEILSSSAFGMYDCHCAVQWLSPILLMVFIRRTMNS
jgi:hypothetical protein